MSSNAEILRDVAGIVRRLERDAANVAVRAAQVAAVLVKVAERIPPPPPDDDSKLVCPAARGDNGATA